MTWRQTKDGYEQEWQLVAANGQIVGEVTGSTYEPDKGWAAHDTRKMPWTHLGCYTTMRAAEAAVEAAMKRKAGKR